MLSLPDEYSGASTPDAAIAGDAHAGEDAGLDGSTGDAPSENVSDAIDGADASDDAPLDAADDVGQTDSETQDGAPPPGTIEGIAAGMRHACAIVRAASTTNVYCWGHCGSNLLTRDCPVNTEVVLEPQLILRNALQQPIEGAKQLAAGENSVCALLTDGTVWCWGNCFGGAVGNPSCTSGITEYPLQVQRQAGGALVGIQTLGGGGAGYCASDSDGQVYCWGDDPMDPPQHNFAAVPGPVFSDGVQRLDTNGLHACALHAGTITCWGANGLLQSSGVPIDAGAPIGPTEVSVGSAAQDLAVGFQHSCAIEATGKLVCWGAWDESPYATEPTLVTVSGAPLTSMRSLTGAYWHQCALSNFGSPWCWGLNPGLWLGGSYVGQEAVEPLVVERDDGSNSALTGMKVISGDGIFVCAASESEVYCWGDLGYSPTVYECVPADGGATSSACSPRARKITGLPDGN